LLFTFADVSSIKYAYNVVFIFFSLSFLYFIRYVIP